MSLGFGTYSHKSEVVNGKYTCNLMIAYVHEPLLASVYVTYLINSIGIYTTSYPKLYWIYGCDFSTLPLLVYLIISQS